MDIYFKNVHSLLLILIFFKYLNFSHTLEDLKYYDNRKDNSGHSCDPKPYFVSPTSVCGVGHTCPSTGKCKEDFSKPFDTLRPVSDQSHSSASRIFSLIHTLDDRILSSQDTKPWFGSRESSTQLKREQLTSISQVKDFSVDQDFISLHNSKYLATSSYINGVNYLLSYQNNLNSESYFSFKAEMDTKRKISSKNSAKPKSAKRLTKILLRDRCFPSKKSAEEQIISEKDIKEFYKEKSRAEEDWFEGLYSIVVAGFGHHPSIGKYILLKFHWGSSFGDRGYVKIEMSLFFERYLAECKVFNQEYIYVWQDGNVNSHYPLLKYKSTNPAFNEVCEDFEFFEQAKKKKAILCLGLENRKHKRASDFHINPEEFNFEEFEFDPRKSANNQFEKRKKYVNHLLNKDPNPYEIPQIRRVLKTLLATINDQHAKVNKDFKDILSGNSFTYLDLVYADLTIVSGRKWYILVQLLPRKNWVGRLSSDAAVFYEAVAYKPAAGYYFDSSMQILTGSFILVDSSHGTIYKPITGSSCWFNPAEYLPSIPQGLQVAVFFPTLFFLLIGFASGVLGPWFRAKLLKFLLLLRDVLDDHRD
eukprot:snap_masked-scaffold_14-processed-gene-5.49-mRNA-1 protein AED:1.00 eAED:1.00 QI:0/0/0/0/1/1/2/0/587